MPAFALLPTASWLWSDAFFPPRPTPHRCVPPTSHFAYPACHPGRNLVALPIRTERHTPHSIATLRRQIATHLARSLPRCPCCLRQFLEHSSTIIHLESLTALRNLGLL